MKEIRVDVDELWKKMLGFRVSIGLLPLGFYHLKKWNPCYEGLKDIGLDVDEIWQKMLGFRVSIGLLPFFWSSHKMKPCYEGLKEIGVDVDKIWKKMLGFRVSIALLPLVLIISFHFKRRSKEGVTTLSSHKMKPCYEGLKEIGVDVDKIWKKMLGFRVSIALLPLVLIISWN